MTSIAEGAMAAGRGIGRYFSVVGMVPSIAAVAWVTFLFAAKAWAGPFEPVNAVHVLSGLGLGSISGLIAAALAIGLVVSPFQFTVTQWMEGYWGGGRLASRFAAQRINRYRREVRGWQVRGQAAEVALIREALSLDHRPDPDSQDDLLEEALRELDFPNGDRLIHLDQVRRYQLRFLERFPPKPSRTMPTRLGNALRTFEDTAGRQYGLDATVVAPHLDLLEPNPRTSYVQDTRQTMDLSIRLCMMALLVTPLTAVLLADDGPWLLLTLAPYTIGYLAYRGAVSCAQAYGNAVRFQIDVDRFTLYRALRVPPPGDGSTERTQNRKLISSLRGETVHLNYMYPASDQGSS